MKSIKAVVVAALLLGAVGCADLDVTNLNDPDAERALSSAGDVESLIAGSFNTWHYQKYTFTGFGPLLSNMSFQHTAPWANFGMEFYGRIPRQPTVNDQSHPDYGQIARSWSETYRAISAVADGLRAIEQDQAIADALGAAAVTRARAYGKFVLGISHATLALAYDRGFVVDETTDISQAQDPVPYTEMMDAAFGYLDEAISLAEGASFTIPAGWMSVEVTADELVQIIHSYKARFRANVARTPDERAAVDWAQVIADVDAGVDDDWIMDMSSDKNFHASGLRYSARIGWSEMNMFINGMADQSGNYQRWLAMPIEDRVPAPAGEAPIIIVTPDTRFPQGSTVAEQQANPGSTYVIPCEAEAGAPEACELSDFAIGNVWARPDRGTWRWSYYWYIDTADYAALSQTEWPEIDYDEMRLLKAEGLYRQGNLAGAADLVNVTRTAAGLNATDAAGTNTSCVPRLPDESCGDLWEMLKWEKRQEARFTGPYMVSWYFDGRGWGDLYEGTPLQFPLPCEDVQVLQLPSGCEQYGGDPGPFTSPGSVYGFEA